MTHPAKLLRPPAAGRLLAGATALLLLLSPRGAAAAESGNAARERALELFSQSKTAYRMQRFAEAAQLLRDAYQLHPEPVLLYNLGRALEGQGDPEGAVSAFELFLEKSPTVTDRPAIEKRIESLKSQIARNRPLEGLVIPKTVEPAPPRKTNPIPWIVVGAGVTGLAAGGVFGLLVRDLNAQAIDPTTSQKRAVEEIYPDAQSNARTANILFAAGGALTLGGAVWLMVTKFSSSDESAGLSRSTRGLAFGVAPGGLSVAGTWP